jgi:hypothetical protein
MRKIVFGSALGAMLFALCVPAEAQQPKKVPQIGVLVPSSAASGVISRDAFLRGCGIWVMLKEKTLRLSIDTQKES